MYIKKKTKLKIKLQQMILIYRQTVGYICKKKNNNTKLSFSYKTMILWVFFLKNQHFLSKHEPFFKESVFFVQK